MREAVILAAGSGSRLGKSLPKALTPLAGKPLIGWIWDALADVGVECAHIIVSSRSSELERAASDLATNIEARFHVCPDWQLGNGRSTAYAEHVVSSDRFFVLMSDHLITPEHLRLVDAHTHSACALGTSSAAPWIDLVDATKVAVDPDGLIRAIGKELEAFDAIDTGVFAMTHSIFPALEEARAAGEYSLTAGNRRLCRDGLLQSASIGTLRWYDIDTPTDLAAATSWLESAPALRRVS